MFLRAREWKNDPVSRLRICAMRQKLAGGRERGASLGAEAVKSNQSGDAYFTEAYLHFNKAADLGSLDALGNVAVLYLNGEGVAPDPKKAASLVEKGATPPDFAVRAPLLDLPRILNTSAATIPDKVPYVFPDAGLVEHWRRELAPLGGVRVGIFWQGNPNHPWDRHRSAPLASLTTPDSK